MSIDIKEWIDYLCLSYGNEYKNIEVLSQMYMFNYFT